MPRITIDWSLVNTAEQFFEQVLPQCGSPDWHGRNLDALNDSWITGGICTGGPPFQFELKNMGSVPASLISMATAVLDIAQSSVAANGGSLIQS